MPNFKSVIHDAPMSMTPAIQPVNKPTKSTHTQPDQASCAPFQLEKKYQFVKLNSTKGLTE
jgi:hypothetical protein